MTPTPPGAPGNPEPKPQVALAQWAKAERQLAAASGLHWSDTPEGGLLVDLVPNPKRYLVADILGHKVAMDCGEPGIHVGK